MTSTDTWLERGSQKRDLEAVLVAVCKFFDSCVRHGRSFLVADLQIHSPIMRLGR